MGRARPGPGTAPHTRPAAAPGAPVPALGLAPALVPTDSPASAFGYFLFL